MQFLFAFMKKPRCCDSCGMEESDTIKLAPEVKHFGLSTTQFLFCSDQCKITHYQNVVMHNLRSAGL
ncbi:hypothetical protein ACGYLM_01620 [Sulfitobacter sp. 1A10445]|uniref:hypothetical protein n=1 Tax=unclassified Sulfitobacter TaxID=196795 RepID=UPI0037457247